MLPRIKKIRRVGDFHMIATFANGISKYYDYLPLLTYSGAKEPIEEPENLSLSSKGHGLRLTDTIDVSAQEIWEHGRSF